MSVSFSELTTNASVRMLNAVRMLNSGFLPQAVIGMAFPNSSTLDIMMMMVNIM